MKTKRYQACTMQHLDLSLSLHSLKWDTDARHWKIPRIRRSSHGYPYKVNQEIGDIHSCCARWEWELNRGRRVADVNGCSMRACTLPVRARDRRARFSLSLLCARRVTQRHNEKRKGSTAVAGSIPLVLVVVVVALSLAAETHERDEARRDRETYRLSVSRCSLCL